MEEVNLEIKKIYFWCDSKTVLNYVHIEHSKFGVYVAHRINKIKKNSSINQWKCMPSNMNIADNATRSISFKQFGGNSRWFGGPTFLFHTNLDDFSEKSI